ncbi:hypothetical protein GCM10023331_00170 [Algivirga pacifica]|uniref:TPR repeat n=2 Tax=Algivirga pacifica TaxID=1162670 RepID=A0ABP9CVR2_9BACT
MSGEEIKVLKQQANKDNAPNYTLYQAGLAYKQEGKIKKSLDILEKAQRHLPSFVLLGDIYQEERKLPDSIGFSYYVKATEAIYPLRTKEDSAAKIAANLKAGHAYYQGKGIQADTTLAIKHYFVAYDMASEESKPFLDTIKNIIQYIPELSLLPSSEEYLANRGYVEYLEISGNRMITPSNSKKEIQQGISYLEQLSEKGNTKAMLRLGLLYKKGIDGKLLADQRKAILYLLKAYNHGDEVATMTLDNLDIRTFIDQDHIDYLRYMADRYQDPKSFFRLYEKYKEGKDVTQDYKKALNYCKDAAYFEYVPAIIALATIYEEGYPALPKKLTLDERYQRALELYTKAAHLNDHYAKFKVGYFYENGLSVPTNLGEAIKWYLVAATEGVDPAKVRLYALQDKIPQFIDKGDFTYVQFLASQPNVDSDVYLTLGKYYMNKKSAVCEEWLLKAANKENEEAVMILADLYTTNTIGIPQDPLRAKTFYHRALNLNVHQADLELAALYCYFSPAFTDGPNPYMMALEHLNRYKNKNLQNHENNLRLLMLSGDIYLKLNDPIPAIQAFSDYIKLFSIDQDDEPFKLFEALYKRGEALFLAQKYDAIHYEADIALSRLEEFKGTSIFKPTEYNYIKGQWFYLQAKVDFAQNKNGCTKIIQAKTMGVDVDSRYLNVCE